jgi:hypothetical protein
MKYLRTYEGIDFNEIDDFDDNIIGDFKCNLSTDGKYYWKFKTRYKDFLEKLDNKGIFYGIDENIHNLIEYLLDVEGRYDGQDFYVDYSPNLMVTYGRSNTAEWYEENSYTYLGDFVEWLKNYYKYCLNYDVI